MTHDNLLLHRRVEDFLYREAELLDRWQLDRWFELFTEDARYLVPPTDIPEDEANPETALYYIVDDYVRIRERVVRLQKKTAHSEYPRSKTRHLVSNIIVDPQDGHYNVRASFAVSRSKDGVTDVFYGHYDYDLVEQDGTLKIRRKTCILDLDALRPHARISIIL